MINFIDSHAHLTSPQVYGDIEEILERAQNAGIKSIINICTNRDTLEKGLQLASQYSWVYNVAATTPHDVEAEGEELFPLMAECARQGKLVAVGETGLDYHYMHSKPEIQQQFLRRYFQLAHECQLPVVIHCRDAFGDFFRILDEEYRGPGVLHCFTGNIAEAHQVIKRGWYLSLSGIVTFKKSEELREVAKMVPLDQLLIETDTPYLAPQSKRGKTNEPSYLLDTAEMIASLKRISLEEVAEATSENGCRLFGITA